MKQKLTIILVAVSLLFISFPTNAFYNTQQGRWLSRDPIQESGGINVCGFVANNPLSYTDPSGLALYAFDGTANVIADQTNIRLTSDTGYTGWAKYLQGIGADDEHTKLVAILQQATGIGLYAKRSKMLRALEDHLNEDSNDTEVDIIGFSRGAVTAVAFANALEKLHKEGVYPYCKIHIRFMGLYDPVPGPGPFVPHKADISGFVEHASIAYSLDETRVAFSPDVNLSGVKAAAFHGGHSDIGGGYHERGLANISLEWMVDQGKAAGAPFKYPASPSGGRWDTGNSFSAKMIGHQEPVPGGKIIGGAVTGGMASRSLGGIISHSSVGRLIPVPSSDNYEHAAAHYYLDKIAPGNDQYNVGDHKF